MKIITLYEPDEPEWVEFSHRKGTSNERTEGYGVR
jgi:hypothetical protein